jgi:hypothetical protein
MDVYCLRRLKESLLHDSRYSQIALTLRANTTMTWDEAVDLLLSYEMTLAPGTSSVTAPRALAGGVDAPVTETVKKLQAKVKTLNRALLRGADTPEMNGVAERGNQTVYNGGYAMLLASNLPAIFWVYAVEYSVVVYNYSPTNTKSGRMQPFNSRFGMVGNVSRFCMWGCIAYIHIPAAVRESTLANKAYRGYFVGFRWPLLDRYRVFVPSLDKVLESAHVHFDEVTPLVRKVDLLLLIDPAKRSVNDFQWLLDLA